MKRIEITRAAVIGRGKTGKVGEFLEVEDAVARLLVNNKQARIAPAAAPAAESEGPQARVTPEPKKGR